VDEGRGAEEVDLGGICVVAPFTPGEHPATKARRQPRNKAANLPVRFI